MRRLGGIVADDPSVRTTAVGRGVVASVSGEMDYLSDPVLWERFTPMLDGASRFIVLDLSEVSFFDSAGLNLLLRADREAHASGVELALACVPSSLRRILQMTGTDQVLRIYDTVAETSAGAAAPLRPVRSR